MTEETTDDEPKNKVVLPPCGILCGIIGIPIVGILACIKNPAACLAITGGGGGSGGGGGDKPPGDDDKPPKDRPPTPHACVFSINLPSGELVATRRSPFPGRYFLTRSFPMRITFLDQPEIGCFANMGEYHQDFRGFAERDLGTGTMQPVQVHARRRPAPPDDLARGRSRGQWRPAVRPPLLGRRDGARSTPEPGRGLVPGRPRARHAVRRRRRARHGDHDRERADALPLRIPRRARSSGSWVSGRLERRGAPGSCGVITRRPRRRSHPCRRRHLSRHRLSRRPRRRRLPRQQTRCTTPGCSQPRPRSGAAVMLQAERERHESETADGRRTLGADRPAQASPCIVTRPARCAIPDGRDRAGRPHDGAPAGHRQPGRPEPAGGLPGHRRLPDRWRLPLLPVPGPGEAGGRSVRRPLRAGG